MRSRQTGITFIGWVILLIPLAVVVFAGIKLSTLYMNNFKVARVLQQISESSGHDGSPIAPPAVRVEVERRFDIEGIEVPTPEDIVIEKEGDNWVMTADYERKTSFVGNISLLVHFYKRVVLQ